MADIAKLVEDLSALSVLEAADLVKALEEKWGVSAAAPVAVALLLLNILLKLSTLRRGCGCGCAFVPCVQRL